jgi:thiamine biosynthesis lipoprotein
MKQTRILMNMPVIIEIVDPISTPSIFDEIFFYFDQIEKKFSIYKQDSEISLINKGMITPEEYSPEMQEVLLLSEETKKATNGYFDIAWSDGLYDPSGLVKGWAIYRAAQMLKHKGYVNFYVDAGGDVQVYGQNSHNQHWRVGIQNPFQPQEIIKVVALSDAGMATSGTYVRGQHIYNPHQKEQPILDIVSLTVIGKNVYDADRFATAAFAMGKKGIEFIEQLPDLEGYMVDRQGTATMTSNFHHYIVT